MKGAGLTTGGAPHVPASLTVAAVMRRVLYALVPGVAAQVWFFGAGVVVQIALAVAFAVAFEALMLKWRGRDLGLFLGDYSAVVTAVLFALCIPPLAPWWISLVGMLFAIVLAKHLYGGLGHNVFNPAMVGYVVALISFPQPMTQWLAPRGLSAEGLGVPEVLRAVFGQRLPPTLDWDAVSMATPLDALKTGLHTGQTIPEITQNPLFGSLGGLGWEWVAAAYLAGGLYLMTRRIIAWHVPAAMLGTLLLLGLTAWLVAPASYPPPAQHLFSGAVMLGAFFIATDPVSGCTSPLGRLWFGAGAGLITLVIRQWGGYPDGVAFAVLLMNMAAPLIDRYTRPRVYGQ
jgi:electron transport complex protein RnfD